MVAAPLVEKDIRDGETLLRRLDRDGFRATAAFWYWEPEDEKWRLIIATPLVKDKGPREAYMKLDNSARRIRKKGFALNSMHVQLVKEEEELPSALRRAVKTGRNIAGIRFSRNVIDGTYIEDAYIYRAA